MRIPINIQIESERVYNDLASRPGQELEPETSKVKVNGYMKKTKDGIQVEYTEHEDSGMGNTVTTISSFSDNNVVSVNRVGQLNSHMVFEQGKCHTCIYDTGFFPMQLRVCTKELTNNLTLDGGKINIDYSIEIVGNLAEKNKLLLSVSPDKSVIIS
ncbi:MAG: hypothetical protein A2Y15_03555 [Clostridiales bacterium GWF2_36_10]|nr:MAG: hypothetical protein A2Y15_03555 [Clostridiales bacterium GWF2_36_10]HAN20300.1 hypothetical protein [Clostridiales bacterium]